MNKSELEGTAHLLDELDSEWFCFFFSLLSPIYFFNLKQQNIWRIF